MPILNVSISAANDMALTERISLALTRITKDVLHKDPSVTVVIVTYVPPENWVIGSDRLDVCGRTSFWLDIKVTSGTNTKSEISEFISSAFSTMNHLLGDISSTSYTVVHEVAASSWGYGGLTQEFRYIASKTEGIALPRM